MPDDTVNDTVNVGGVEAIASTPSIEESILRIEMEIEAIKAHLGLDAPVSQPPPGAQPRCQTHGAPFVEIQSTAQGPPFAIFQCGCRVQL